MPSKVPSVTAGDIRAEIARRRMKIYQLAAVVRLHPAHLGSVLNEKTPLTAALSERICDALKSMEPPTS